VLDWARGQVRDLNSRVAGHYRGVAEGLAADPLRRRIADEFVKRTGNPAESLVDPESRLAKQLAEMAGENRKLYVPDSGGVVARSKADLENEYAAASWASRDALNEAIAGLGIGPNDAINPAALAAKFQGLQGQDDFGRRAADITRRLAEARAVNDLQYRTAPVARALTEPLADAGLKGKLARGSLYGMVAGGGVLGAVGLTSAGQGLYALTQNMQQENESAQARQQPLS